MIVLYGSQTGNAQDVADRIVREARHRHFKAAALPLDAVSVHDLPAQGLAIFVCSTTGQGETPDGMKATWRQMLRKALPRDALSSLRYAVFGLGDSGYVQFNVVAKKLDRRLEQLGGCRVLEKGLGDDQARSGYESALDPWLTRLWSTLRALYPLPDGLSDPPADAPPQLDPPRYQVTVLPNVTGSASTPESLLHDVVVASESFRRISAASRVLAPLPTAASSAPTAAASDRAVSTAAATAGSRYVMAPVVVNRRITAEDHSQAVHHIELDTSGTALAYAPGDLLTVLPQGTSCVVSARALAAGVLDVASASPRRRLFELMSHFAADAVQRERLAYFGSAEGRDDLTTYCARERRTVLEVLQDFPSVQLPVAYLLEAAPLLKPRQFSLSSSPCAHPGRAHVTVAVVGYRTPFKRRVHGLCSSWLAGLAVGEPVPVFMEKGALALPADPNTPIICVGPGTGVAPFRSFLHERAATKRAGEPAAPGCLFFGCRYSAKDFLYAEEWENLLAEGVLHGGCGLVCAFSRDQEQKVYVQDRIRQHAGALWRLLHEGDAVVYVSGSASKMPADVSRAFADVISAGLGCGAADAERLRAQLEAGKRYFVEAWS